jgi:hypothetical protein
MSTYIRLSHGILEKSNSEIILPIGCVANIRLSVSIYPEMVTFIFCSFRRKNGIISKITGERREITGDVRL